MISIDIVPTEKCSWKCSYCSFPEIKNTKNTTYDIIKKHNGYIRDIVRALRSNKIDVQLYLQGGEVGELPYSLLLYLLEQFNMKMTISTNGLFLQKGYHKDSLVRKYIDKIYWHTSPDCGDPIIQDYEDEKIIRGVVHRDQGVIDWFIKNTNLNIEYARLEEDLSEPSTAPLDTIIRCRKYNNDIVIDLVNEKLCLCIRNFRNATVDLNPKNLMKSVLKFPNEIFDIPPIMESACYSCCRLCVDKTHNNLIKDKLLLRNLL